MSPATETATEDLATAETEAEPASPENAEAAAGDVSTDAGYWHVVEQGDTLLRIGEQHGQKWEAIWKHPENRDLRTRRVHPHILKPGDRVFVPRPSLKLEPLGAGGALHFVKSTNRTALRVRLEDAEGKPLAYRPCRLRAGDDELAGTTDEHGVLEHEVPVETEHGFLRLENTTRERLEFLQPAVLAPPVGDEYNTIRAYFRTPLDPDFTARLRLDATRLIIACRELLERGATEGTDGEDERQSLAAYLDVHANRIRVAAAGELGAESVAQSAGSEPDGEPPPQDETSKRLSVMVHRAQRRAEKAREATNGEPVRRRCDQDTQVFEQQVQESLNDLFKGHQTGFTRVSGRVGRAGGGEGVDRLARCAAKEAADREGQTPEDAAQAARDYLLDMLDRNVGRAGRRLRRDLRQARQGLDELTTVATLDAEAQQPEATPPVAESYGRLLGEALDVLGSDAKRLGRRHELPTDCVVDVLLTEGRRLICETEQHARTLVPEPAEQEPVIRKEIADADSDDALTAPRSIDREVGGAYDALRARSGKHGDSVDAAEEPADGAEAQAKEQALRDGSAKVVELREVVAKRVQAARERQHGASSDPAPQDPRQRAGEADQSDETEHVPPWLPAPQDDEREAANDRPFEHIPIRIGYLDPINTMSGVIGRLNNLGFDAGPPNAFMGEYTRQAIREFQYVEGLPVSGEIDAATLGRLLERHGC